MKRFRRSLALLTAIAFAITSPCGLLIQVAFAQQSNVVPLDPGPQLNAAAAEISRAFLAPTSGMSGAQTMQTAVQRGRSALAAARAALARKKAEVEQAVSQLVATGRDEAAEISDDVRAKVNALQADVEKFKANVTAAAEDLAARTEAAVQHAEQTGAAVARAAVADAKALAIDARHFVSETAEFVIGLGVLAVQKTIAACKAAIHATRDELHKAKEKLDYIAELSYLKALQAAGWVKVKVGETEVFIKDRIIELAALVALAGEVTVEALDDLAVKTQAEITELKEAISRQVNRVIAAGKAEIAKLGAELQNAEAKLREAAAEARAEIQAGIEHAKYEMLEILHRTVDFAVLMVALGAVVADDAIAAVRAVSHRAVELAKQGVDAVRRGLSTLKNDLKIAVQAAAAEMAKLKAQLADMEAKIVAGAIELTDKVFETMVAIKAKIISIGKATVAMVRNTFYATIGAIVLVGEKIKEEVAEAAEHVRAFFQELEEAVDALCAKLDAAMDRLKNAAEEAAEAAQADVKAAVEALEFLLENAMAAIADVGYTITGLAIMGEQDAKAAVQAIGRELDHIRDVIRQADQMGRQAWGH